VKFRLVLAAALTLALGAAVTQAALGAGSHGHAAYQFNGTIAAVGSSSVTLQIEGGSHNALKALIGQSQQQTFAIGSSTEILVSSGGTPHVGSIAELRQGDLATVRIRAAARASLAQLEATSAATVTDRGTGGHTAAGLLYLYQGTVAGPQSGGHVALHVTSGNWRGLRTMLGQSLDQSFAYGDGTIFLLWQGRVPTVIDASQLKAGDRITIRVRAGAAATLAQVEATAAVHVGDHEPGNPETEQ
jgi:hypothetical protein